jgi:hypothetical protein
MSSTVLLNANTLAIVLYLLIIVIFALVLNRLRALTNLLIKPAAVQSRPNNCANSRPAPRPASFMA